MDDAQKRALALYKAPFVFDKTGGYILDANGTMVADGEGSAVGNFIAQALTEFWQKNGGSNV